MKNILQIVFFALALSGSCAFAEDREPFVVGFIVPLSGPLTGWGEAIRNGVSLAVGESTSAQSRCKTLFEDSKYDPKTAVSILQKMMKFDKVNVVYNFGGPTTDAVAPLADKAKLPLVSSESEPRFSEGRPFVIRSNSPSEEAGRRILEFLRTRKIRKVAIVRTENQYINGISRGLKAVSGDEIEYHDLGAFEPGDSDFRSVVTRLSRGSYDAVGALLLPGQAAQFYRQLEFQKYSPVTFGIDTLEDRAEQESAGPAVIGAVFPNNVVSKEFHDRYVATFGGEAHIAWAGISYEFMRIVDALFCKGYIQLSGTQIVEAFKTVRVPQSVVGAFEYKETASTDKYLSVPYLLRQVTTEGTQNLP